MSEQQRLQDAMDAINKIWFDYEGDMDDTMLELERAIDKVYALAETEEQKRDVMRSLAKMGIA